MDPHQKLQGAQQGEDRLVLSGFRAKSVNTAAAMLQSGVLFLIHRLGCVDFGTVQSVSYEGLVVLQSNHTLISTNSENCPRKEDTTEIHQGDPSRMHLPAMMLLRWQGEHTIIRGQHCLTAGVVYQKRKATAHQALFEHNPRPLVLLGISFMYAAKPGCLMSFD